MKIITSEPILLVDDMLRLAYSKRASDIHIEPFTHTVQIRFRIDGVLHKEKEIALNQFNAVIARIKIMANLDIAEKRLPQDGHFRFFIDSKLFVDCRISSIATVLGEKIVIRLLPPIVISDLQQLGMNSQQQTITIESLQKANGLLLICGPTGSGKTRTLYTLIEQCNHQQKNICTIEDPIEIQLNGIQQIEVHPKIGLSFSTILRALLRQDPDIILIGEIRDQKTAKLAIHAANTGHLVLSTIHSNNINDAFLRLIHLGISSLDIKQSIRLIIAQRLVKILCQHCKKPTSLTTKQKKLLNYFSNQSLDQIIYEAAGCPHCLNGYFGRTGIFEFSTKEFSLQQHGLEKLLSGNTSYQELTTTLDFNHGHII